MTMEELVKAAEKVAEAWLAFGKQLKEAVDAVSEVFNAAFGSPELWPKKKDGTTPKKYGMSLRKCQRRTSVHYHYIPTTPRNLPYMRRAY